MGAKAKNRMGDYTSDNQKLLSLMAAIKEDTLLDSSYKLEVISDVNRLVNKLLAPVLVKTVDKKR